LVVRQIGRRAWKPNAHYIFDKILYDEYDRSVSKDFFKSHGVFLVREPGDSIRSILNLLIKAGRANSENHLSISHYYEERLKHLIVMWNNFSAQNRVGLSFSELTDDSEKIVSLVSDKLALNPPLKNAYSAPAKSIRRGEGDPFLAHAYNRIMGPDRASTIAVGTDDLDIAPQRMEALQLLYRETVALFRADRT
jgi:hypothetical protein